ncbi:hypothetical protein GLA29479_4560 [Lysobacter antibioticus]|nr:hypothetical protein GLA29479_4560 [Lysobacter antibioticus]
MRRPPGLRLHCEFGATPSFNVNVNVNVNGRRFATAFG